MDRIALIKNVIARKSDYYKEYFIPKRNGGRRYIQTPTDELKFLQKEILWSILNHISLHPAAKGFVRNQSIYTNAKRHLNSVCIINLDLKDFFPTITKEMVIERLSPFVESPNAIAEVVTYQEHLPQGAPTSPYISNIMCLDMDKKFVSLAGNNKARYTRYADDLTFSSKTNTNLDKIIPKVHSIVKHQGFELNYDKVHVMRKGSRQVVTGLVVNDKVNVQRSKLRKVRAEIHNKEIHGATPDEISTLNGMVAYISSVNKDKAIEFSDKIKNIKVL